MALPAKIAPQTVCMHAVPVRVVIFAPEPANPGAVVLCALRDGRGDGSRYHINRKSNTMKPENLSFCERFRDKVQEYRSIQTIPHISIEDRRQLESIYREEIDKRIAVDLYCPVCFLDDLLLPLFNHIDSLQPVAVEDIPFPDCLDFIAATDPETQQEPEADNRPRRGRKPKSV